MPTPDLSRRKFLGACCASVGATGLLSTLAQLRLMGAVASPDNGPVSPPRAGAPQPDYKALVCLFLAGGNDANNLVVPADASGYSAYATARGALALPQTSLLPIATPGGDGRAWALHPAMTDLKSLYDRGKLAVVANVGTLIQPITKSQFNAWENGNSAALPVPKALFSHSDQIEQWQTAVPQGMSQLSGWAGRCSDILHAYYNTGGNSMSISLGGNNVFQVGNTTQQFVITPSGALSFEGNTGGANPNPLQIKNTALRNTLDQTYTNLLTESFSRLTRESDDAQSLFQTRK